MPKRGGLEHAVTERDINRAEDTFNKYKFWQSWIFSCATALYSIAPMVRNRKPGSFAGHATSPCFMSDRDGPNGGSTVERVLKRWEELRKHWIQNLLLLLTVPSKLCGNSEILQ